MKRFLLTFQDFLTFLLSPGTIYDQIYFFHSLNKSLCILELTVGYESNLRSNAEKKKQKYWELAQQLKNDYDKVNFVNLSISALDIYDKSTTDFITMIKTLKFEKSPTNYIIKKLTSKAILTSYCIFCRWNKEWTDPELMTL